MAGFGSKATRERARGARAPIVLPVLLAAALTLGGCSVPQWADPTEWFAGDEPAPAPAPVTNGQASNGSSQTNERFPNLARVPPRPVEVSSEGERRQALDTLAADRANARHTDQELRARPADSNTPPPPPRAPVTQLPSSSEAPAAAPVQAAPEQSAQNAFPAAQPEPQRQPQSQSQQSQSEQPVILQPPAPTAPAQNQPRTTPSANTSVSDTYSQSLSQSAATSVPPNMAQSSLPPARGTGAIGGVQNGAGTLLAVIRFSNGESRLGNDDRALLRRVVEYYKGAANGAGTLNVVGFASSRTGNMEPSAHRQLNYSLSQKRAEAVAAELRRRGVAADRIRTEARADAAPVYYEAMPRAEEYNRRVEIYLVN